MKKLTKALLLVLVIVMVASFMAACTPKTEPAPAATSTTPPPAATPAETTTTAPAIKWDPTMGPPPSFDPTSEVYTMDNRVPWQGIYEPPETSRANLVKAISALNKKDDVTVGYVTWTVGTPFFASQADTIKAMCEQYGWTYLSAVSDADVNKQIANIETFVTRGVDIIIDCAFSSDAEALAINNAAKAGVPVIGLGLPFPAGTQTITNMATMFYEHGFADGIYVADKFDGVHIKGAFIPGQIGHPIGESKLNGFIGGFIYQRAILMGKPFPTIEAAMMYGYNLEQQITKNAKFTDPDFDWEIVGSIDGMWSKDGGQKAAEDILTAHPDINFMFTDNDQEAMGAILAMQQAGLNPGKDIQICCVGDGSIDALRMVQDGTIMCMTFSSPYTWAGSCIELAHKIFVDGFDATNLPSNVYLSTILIDKDSVAKWIPTDGSEYPTQPMPDFIPLSS